MSELSEVGPDNVRQHNGNRFVPRWLMIFLCRLGWTPHPDADEWRRAGYQLRKTFLEDWTSQSR